MITERNLRPGSSRLAQCRQCLQLGNVGHDNRQRTAVAAELQQSELSIGEAGSGNGKLQRGPFVGSESEIS